MAEESEESTMDERDDAAEDVDSDDSAEEEMLQDEVADVPFEVLQKAKAEGHCNIPRNKAKAETKRLNKNRPMEISSKKPVRTFREVIQAPKRMVRDPRFESLCGNFEETRFKKSYSFLYDESLPDERQRLYESLKKEKDPNVIDQTKKRLALIDRQLKSEVDRRKLAEKEGEQRKKERELVKHGKKPYFLKKSDKRKEKLIEKYKELKASGKLEPFLEKRRRKNAAKDHRYMPYRRSQT